MYKRQGQLYNEPLTTYSSTQTLDPLNPLVPAQAYAQLSGGNPGLKPERGKVDYLGGVIDLDSVVKGLSFSVDHYAISLTTVSYTHLTIGLRKLGDYFAWYGRGRRP